MPSQTQLVSVSELNKKRNVSVSFFFTDQRLVPVGIRYGDMGIDPEKRRRTEGENRIERSLHGFSIDTWSFFHYGLCLEDVWCDTRRNEKGVMYSVKLRLGPDRIPSDLAAGRYLDRMMHEPRLYDLVAAGNAWQNARCWMNIDGSVDIVLLHGVSTARYRIGISPFGIVLEEAAKTADSMTPAAALAHAS